MKLSENELRNKIFNLIWWDMDAANKGKKIDTEDTWYLVDKIIELMEEE